MKLLRYIHLTIILAAIYACGGGSYDKQLVEIDSLTMNKKGLEALALLDSMEVSKLSKADRMYFELLKIKARDKAFIIHNSDSGLQKLVEYFETHDKEKLPEAYYYAGSVYRDMNDAPQALSFFQKAISSMPEDYNLKLKGNAYFQCGDLFQRQQLKRQGIEMMNEAYRYDSLLKDTIRMIESLTTLAEIHGIILERKEFDSVVFAKFNKALQLAREINNQDRIDLIKYKYAYVYSYLNQYNKVEEYLPLLKKMSENNEDLYYKKNSTYLLARRCIALKKYDEALPYCEYLYNCDYEDYCRYAAQYLFKIYASKGNMAKANTYVDRYEFMTDSMMVSKAYNATAQADALYNYQLRERDNLTLKAESQHRLYTIFILCAIFIFIFLIFLIYRINHKREKQILRQQVARLSQLEKIQREQNESLMAENNRRIDELEISRLSAQVTTAKRNLVRSKLLESEAYELLRQRLAKDKPLKGSDITFIDDSVNNICDGFKSTLYSAYNLSSQEYTICLLLKFELSATDISHLLSRTASAITQTRKRLFLKLFGREGSANELDTYIRSL